VRGHGAVGAPQTASCTPYPPPHNQVWSKARGFGEFPNSRPPDWRGLFSNSRFPAPTDGALRPINRQRVSLPPRQHGPTWSKAPDPTPPARNPTLQPEAPTSSPRPPIRTAQDLTHQPQTPLIQPRIALQPAPASGPGPPAQTGPGTRTPHPGRDPAPGPSGCGRHHGRRPPHRARTNPADIRMKGPAQLKNRIN